MLNRRVFNWGALAGAGVVTALSSEAAKAASQPVTSLLVLYPNHEGARFDFDYYRNTHIPLAMKVMKADKVTLTEGLPGKDAPPPFVMICHFQFASPEALAAANARPEMADVRADVAKATDIKPIVMAGKTS